MLYAILRIDRAELPGDVETSTPPQVGIKFFPLRLPSGDYLTVDASTPERAFSLACEKRPTLRHILAITPHDEYLATASRLAAARDANPRAEHPRNKPRRPVR